jgi:hypothetical protein
LENAYPRARLWLDVLGCRQGLSGDGQSIYVGFPNDGRLMASALGLDGQILWQTKITDYIEHQGYGASPALYQSLVIIAADTKAGGAIAGLDRSRRVFRVPGQARGVRAGCQEPAR